MAVGIELLEIKKIENGSNIDLFACAPGDASVYLTVFSQIDWIRNLTGGDLCETDRRHSKNALRRYLIGSGLLVGFVFIVFFLLWTSHDQKRKCLRLTRPAMK